MKKVKSILFALSLLTCVSLAAQQDPMYTHYMYNMLSVNPAYAGSEKALHITALHRSQWTGFKGAPLTQAVNMHAPLKEQNIGLGLSLLNDRIGPVNFMTANADFAYRMKMSSKATLALGLKAGVNIMQANLMGLALTQSGDAAFEYNIKSKALPNFGFGAWFQGEKLIAGLSVPKLLENDYKTNTITGGTDPGSEKRHYYLITGYTFTISDAIDLKPTSYVKMTKGAPVEADLTTMFVYKKKFFAGAMFRTGDAAGLLIGMNITARIYAGYSYDWSFINRTFTYNYGSHEVILVYKLKTKDSQASFN